MRGDEGHRHKQPRDDADGSQVARRCPAHIGSQKPLRDGHPVADLPFEAPALDENLKPLHGGRALRHVGSQAVRDAIDKYQPMLTLHGHIHEGKGITRIGKTLAINAGSAYEEGVLLAAIIELDQKKGIKNYQLVNG